LELQERADRGLLDTGHGAIGREAESDRHRHGLVVVEQERRQGSAGTEAIAARGAAGRGHRVAEPAQPVHVTAQRPSRDIQALGQLRAGPFAADLQQGQQMQQAGGHVEHAPEYPMIAARN
jgi:hypothetical protein